MKNLRLIFDWRKQFNKVAYDCRSIEFKAHGSYFRLFNLYMKHRTLMILHFLTIQTLKYLIKTLWSTNLVLINVAYVIFMHFCFQEVLWNIKRSSILWKLGLQYIQKLHILLAPSLYYNILSSKYLLTYM